MLPHAGTINLLLGARLRYECNLSTSFGIDTSICNIFASLAVHLLTDQVDPRLHRGGHLAQRWLSARMDGLAHHLALACLVVENDPYNFGPLPVVEKAS